MLPISIPIPGTSFTTINNDMYFCRQILTLHIVRIFVEFVMISSTAYLVHQTITSPSRIDVAFKSVREEIAEIAAIRDQLKREKELMRESEIKRNEVLKELMRHMSGENKGGKGEDGGKENGGG